MPELVRAAQGVQKGKLYGAIADIFYGIGAITKDVYGEVKSRTHQYTAKILEVAEGGLKSYISGKDDSQIKNYQGAVKMEDYIPNVSKKVTASILGVFGIGLIISSGLSLTGNVVGGGFGWGSGLIGGLFLLIALGLFLRKRF